MKLLSILLIVFVFFFTSCSSHTIKPLQPSRTEVSTKSPTPKKSAIPKTPETPETPPVPSPTPEPGPEAITKTEKNRRLIAKGDKLLSEKRYEGALAEYEKALKLKPNQEMAVFGTAIVYLETREYKKSLEILSSYINKHPEKVHPDFLITRSTVNLALGKLDNAEKDVKRAIKLGADKTPSELLLAKVYCAKGYPEKSIKIAEKLLDKDPNLVLDNKNSTSPQLRAGFLHSIGVAYFNCGRLDESLDCFNKSLELYEDPWTINERGYTYFHNREPEKAKADMKRWLALNPAAETANELEAMAVAKMILEEYDEALHYANMAIEKAPGQPGFFCIRGQIYMWMGDRENATKDFKLLYRIGNPNFKVQAGNYLKRMEANINSKNNQPLQDIRHKH